MKEHINAEVMIVDDEPIILQLLSDFLESKGTSSISFKSPVEAYSNLINSPPFAIKLLLLDIKMPEMNGLEMLKKIMILRPFLKVLMISGQKDMNIIQDCMNAGAKDYLTKPIDLEYLETCVRMELLTTI